jgi:hypothetical protein
VGRNIFGVIPKWERPHIALKMMSDIEQRDGAMGGASGD